MKKINFFIILFVCFAFSLNASEYLFSSEAVTEGHPDKICDQISDAIVDEVLLHDENGQVNCETLITNGIIIIAGEISTSHHFDVVDIVRNVLKDIGYDRQCNIIQLINKKAFDKPFNIYEQKANCQGVAFGYACKETKELMPLSIILANKLAKRLSDVRKENILPWLRPDGKAQVSVKYINNKPKEIDTIAISIQYDPNVRQNVLKEDIIEFVIKPVCSNYLTTKTKYLINETDSFVLSGQEDEIGSTGRKILSDTYGGIAKHSEGCFSGKDPLKIDRFASYMARHIAKNIVAANLADLCEVQLTYSFGKEEPVSIYVNTFGTAKIKEEILESAIRRFFPLQPNKIIQYLDLKKPIYKKTASYGHFGREEEDFMWEKLNKVEVLQNFVLRQQKEDAPPLKPVLPPPPAKKVVPPPSKPKISPKSPQKINGPRSKNLQKINGPKPKSK
jgi:S-adenosylmethionine synthetase